MIAANKPIDKIKLEIESIVQPYIIASKNIEDRTSKAMKELGFKK